MDDDEKDRYNIRTASDRVKMTYDVGSIDSAYQIISSGCTILRNPRIVTESIELLGRTLLRCQEDQRCEIPEASFLPDLYEEVLSEANLDDSVGSTADSHGEATRCECVESG